MDHQVAGFMRRLYHRGLTTTTGGNISARDDGGVIRVTPAGLDKAHVAADDIVVIGTDGAIRDRRPSSEFPLHRAIYEERPDVRAIVHAHPPALVAYSICREVPDLARLPRAAAFCGAVAYVPYAPTGSEDLGRRAIEALGPRGRSAVLENHGAIALGASVSEAYVRFECLERSACALMRARTLEKIVAPNAAPAPLLPAAGSPGLSSRDDLCRWADRACKRGLLNGATGAFSGRAAGGGLMTPPEVDLEDLEPPALIPATGLHAAIYASHPAIGAVAEAAPPDATAFCIAGHRLSTRTIPESMIVLGEVVTIDDRADLADAISPERPAVLVAGRGAVTAGRSLAEAFDRLEVLEATARSLIDAHGLGRPVLLDG